MAVGIPLGPYRLVRRLATGGMAEIFLARQEGPDGFARELVVKRILPHLAADPEFTRMFRDEAKLAALLSHPNVVHVYDFGAVPDADGTTLYLAMELVRGVDLRALIVRALADAKRTGRTGAIPAHHAAKIASFVCEGLAHAHSVRIDGRPAGIVHRDVTPSNVLLSFDGAVKLADFGIAKAATTSKKEATEHGVVKGKYTYLSPEQARGEPLDARSDLFNVGILIFESVLGEALFPPSDQRLSRKLSASGKLPRPERLERLPPALAKIAHTALSARREDRHADALALRSELEAYLRSCPEPSDTVELGRFVRQVCAGELQEDAQGPRAAGTVAAARSLQGTQQLTGQAQLTEQAQLDGRAQIASRGQPAAPGAARAPAPGTEPLADAGTTDPSGTAIGDAQTTVTPAPRARPSAPAPSRPSAPPSTMTSGVLPLQTQLTGLAGASFTHTAMPDLPTHGSALVPIATDVAGPLPPPAHTTPILRTRPARWPWLAASAIVLAAIVGALAVILGGDAGGEVAGRVVTMPRPASLRVDSDPPGARLFVDGVEHGATPTVLTSVAAGRPVRLEVRDVSGGVLDQAEVSLSEGESREVTLRAAPQTGLVRVSSEPAGATVSIDGERAGQTPLEHTVTLGEHRVRVELAGFAQEDDVVRVEAAGDRASLSFTLRAAAQARPGPRDPRPDSSRQASARGPTGTLRVATTPWSEVFEGGRRLGETPLQIELPAGRHTLTLRSPDRPARTEPVEIRAGEVTRVRLIL